MSSSLSHKMYFSSLSHKHICLKSLSLSHKMSSSLSNNMSTSSSSHIMKSSSLSHEMPYLSLSQKSHHHCLMSYWSLSLPTGAHVIFTTVSQNAIFIIAPQNEIVVIVSDHLRHHCLKSSLSLPQKMPSSLSSHKIKSSVSQKYYRCLTSSSWLSFTMSSLSSRKPKSSSLSQKSSPFPSQTFHHSRLKSRLHRCIAHHVYHCVTQCHFRHRLTHHPHLRLKSHFHRCLTCHFYQLSHVTFKAKASRQTSLSDKQRI